LVSPVPRLSVPDHVFAQLSEAIVTGRYKPGERLPPQRALAAELEVNMASVREALKRLEQLRLVEVRHGDATRVLDWRRSGGLEALVLRGAGDEPFARDLFEARRLLLVEAASLAAARRSDAHARTLRELADAISAAPDDVARLAADWEFMAALVEAAGNLVFQLIMNSVRQLYRQRAPAFAAIVAPGKARAALYARAAEAVTARDADGAARAIEELASAQARAVLR
jgi:GntR family transcriptional regulator, transcriptional repressor for pyruvate dehydrogenase complex